MGLRTARGGDLLPDLLLSAAKHVVEHLDPSQYSELFRLASNARQRIMGSPVEWRAFDGLLLEAGIDRSNRNHVTALVLTLMPKVLKQEKFAKFAAAREARERLKKLGLQVSWGSSGKFAVSTESSASIDKGANRFASALDRFSKK